jgi:hypothetical protein
MRILRQGLPWLGAVLFIKGLQNLADIGREAFTAVLASYSLAFVGFLLVYYGLRHARFSKIQAVFFIGALGMIGRCSFLNSIPSFSQDFYRFIWDGLLWHDNINAYMYAPTEVALKFDHPLKQTLLEGMGELSRKHHSNYPPLNQFLFFLTSWGEQTLEALILKLRLLLICFDLLAFLVSLSLLHRLQLPVVNAALFFLNPLVILETAGNLHFEVVMWFFCVVALFFIFNNRWHISAGAWAMAILTKLLPLLLLPLLFTRRQLSSSFWTVVITVVLTAAFFVLGLSLFAPAISWDNYYSTLQLWFGTFEFNASVYYILRYLGFELVGYNAIASIAPVLSLLTFLIVIGIAVYRFFKYAKIRSLPMTMMFSLFVYLILATTVHPWYLLLPLGFSMFTRYRFMTVWSLTVILSYQAYGNPNFSEDMRLIFIEYIIVLIYLGLEYCQPRWFEKLKQTTSFLVN